MKNNRFIPLSIPNICGNEVDYITRTIQEGWVSTSSPMIEKFEQKIAKYLSIQTACACQSGTAGIHLCLRHFEIGVNDIVLVPTLTFIATINAVSYQGATPVFFDCNENLCINPAQILEYIETHCTFDGSILTQTDTGAVVKAMIPVHVFGFTCNMDEIMDIAKKYNLIVIEDAAQSIGTTFATGRYKGKQTGTIGHAGVISFNGNKIITTGGGGMVVSEDAKVTQHIRYLSQQSKDDALYFIHNEIGYNYRMTSMQAAMGVGQLELLDGFIQNKQANFNRYQERLACCSFAKIMPIPHQETSNLWFYSLVLNQADSQKRDALLHYLIENKIQSRPIWQLNHRQKPFEHALAMDTSTAQKFYDSILNIPCSTQLTIEEVDIVCDVILSFNGE